MDVFWWFLGGWNVIFDGDFVVNCVVVCGAEKYANFLK
jgi:hypothetical protein